MKIIFLGTPDFALPSLDVVNDHFDLIAVITAPDKRGGRGHGWIESPVKSGHLNIIKIVATKEFEVTQVPE